jgi:hypothetical protein
MAKSSIVGGRIPPEQLIHGKDMQSLGPGDSSDTGSDTLGAYSEEELASDSDAVGTGERAGVGGDQRPDADILPDRAVDEADFLDDSAEGEDPEAENGEGADTRVASGVEGVADVAADDDDEDGESAEGEEGEGGEGGDAAARGGGA